VGTRTGTGEPSWYHPNALYPIESTESGIVSSERATASENADSSINLKPVPNVTEVRELKPEKTHGEIVESPFPMEIDVIVEPANAANPIDVTLSERVRAGNCPLRKAKAPIEVTVLGRVREVMLVETELLL
jgi:hypothetical protein